MKTIIIRVVGATAILAGSLMFQAQAADEPSSARGGRLYDKFWTEVKTAKPETSHPSYPADGKYQKDASWRCKECHGWDYTGKDGAYGPNNKHFTGIKGINGAAGKPAAAIVAILKDKTHGYTDAHMSARDMADLAEFVSKGQVAMAQYVDAATGKPKGDAAKGAVHYGNLCANCHGADGKLIGTAPPLGSLQNNWETMHKILNGQPSEKMPALRSLDMQVTVDLAAHVLTLPQQ